MEIHGVPYTSREDLSVTIKGLAEKLNINTHPAEVVACLRLRSRQKGVAPILVVFHGVGETAVDERSEDFSHPFSGPQIKKDYISMIA